MRGGEVAATLAYLRQLQRTFDVAVAVVHHTRKNTRPGAAGQNLRGSGDFHAWYDSSLHLHRHKDVLVLTPEHCTAPAPGSVTLRLHAAEHADDTHFEVVDPPAEPGDTAVDLEADILAALSCQPLTRDQLRAMLRVRNQRLGMAIDRMAKGGRITRQHDCWAIPAG